MLWLPTALLIAAASAQTAVEPSTAALPGRPRAAPRRQEPNRTPGIYPVYELQGRWVLVDRFARGAQRSARPGASFLVVGSKAAELFTVSGSSMVWSASCHEKRPARTPILYLAGKGQTRVGSPIVAIAVSGRSVDPRTARFYRLESRVGEDTYASLGEALKQETVDDLVSGDFLIDVDDAQGAFIAQDPSPERVQLKIDFGSDVRLAGARRAFALVDGVQVSKTFRRCLRLFVGGRPAGRCSEMPHALMAETNLLDFVAYDPNGRGRPFLFAYTTREPLWGHERWGWRITTKGPRRFMLDALDPKCRDRW